MNNNNNNNNDPPLCATGCGFYGNPAQQNLCSKCFRDSLKKVVVQQEQPLTTTLRTNNIDVVKVNDENESGAHMNMMMKKNRCCSCKKRVGLTGFECKCGEVYCGSHRYPEMHSCPFDYKTLQREALSKTLYAAAECKADKLNHRL